VTYVSPLPVELIDFSARAMEGEVLLGWATATETNNDFFTIERSHDGRTFQKIATIPGKGNSLVLNEYSFLDDDPLNGINYYRLKQTDFDGQFSYSDIETVEFRNENSIKIYPTLVAESLTIETDAGFGTESNIIIRDMTGRIFKSFLFPAKEYRKEIMLADLFPGNYFITISNSETVKTYKFIKL
jgi:hypothetical protein